MLQGFKDFLLRGNIVDLAVAVVIGTAFTALVGSFTENFINPLLATLGGEGSTGFGPVLKEGNPATFMNIGAFITAIITFVLTAAVVYFFVVVPMKKVQARMEKPAEEEAPAEDITLLREIRDALAARG